MGHHLTACTMAKVTDPSGTGLFPGGIVIDTGGNAYLHRHPYDARTPEQLRFRQLMRGLYNVLPEFGDAVDADLRAQAVPAWLWSAYTFGERARPHGDAINADLGNYGRGVRCSE